MLSFYIDMAKRRQKSYNVLLIFTCLIFLIFLFIVIYIYHQIFHSRSEVEGWGRNSIRNASLYVHPLSDTSLTHADPYKCSSNQLVTIIVCSDTKNFKPRKAIRETWAKNAEDFKVNVLFLVGSNKNEKINANVLTESVRYKDMIIEDFIDTYNNLTLKTIFLLKWVKNHCRQVPLLMKTDDDMYINVTNLYNFASRVSREDLPAFLVGRTQMEDFFAKRSPRSKWYMPTYMYPDKLYPRYLKGAAYLMSAEVAERLYFQSILNKFVYLEDVFITGICAKQINISPVNHPLFDFVEFPDELTNCSQIRRWSHLIVLSHPTSVYLMYKIRKLSIIC